MRVLVTGVSGTIGSAVARALLARGHQVIGVTNSGERPVPEGVERRVADLFTPDALSAALDEADGAVHAASSNDEHAGELDRVTVGAMIDAFGGTRKPLIYTSGLWVHGDTDAEVTTENSPLRPPMVVGWRPDIEKLLLDSGVHAVRIRPGLVYGHGRGYVPMLLAPQNGVVRHIGDGGNRWAVVHSDDLGELYTLALEGAPAGSVYLAATDESPRVRDVAKVSATATGARVEAWDPEDARTWWGPMVDAFLLDQNASSARAQAELGWRPRRGTLLSEVELPS